MSEVTITESEYSHYTPRHSHYTRLSAKFPRKSEVADKSGVKKEEIMDYCYNSSRSASTRARGCPTATTGRWCTCQRLFELLLFIGILAAFYCYMLSSFGKLQKEITELKESMPGVKRSQQKQQQKCASLEKSCAAQLQLLLRDPVGRPDFALESTGGRIVNVKNTVSHSSPKTLFGLTLCEGKHGPSTMIQATTSPGECWAFKGGQGGAIIQLIGSVKVDAVTLEHIPATLAPNGVIDSAPKDFQIWGCDDVDGSSNRNLLGQFTYEKDGDTFQTFPINNTRFYEFVDFMVISNHGNEEFTCIYRLQVHGTLQKFV